MMRYASLAAIVLLCATPRWAMAEKLTLNCTFPENARCGGGKCPIETFVVDFDDKSTTTDQGHERFVSSLSAHWIFTSELRENGRERLANLYTLNRYSGQLRVQQKEITDQVTLRLIENEQPIRFSAFSGLAGKLRTVILSCEPAKKKF